MDLLLSLGCVLLACKSALEPVSGDFGDSSVGGCLGARHCDASRFVPFARFRAAVAASLALCVF